MKRCNVTDMSWTMLSDGIVEAVRMLAHSGLHLEADLVEQRNERQNGGGLLYLHAQLVDANEHIGHKEAGRHERAPHDRPQRKGQRQ